MTIGASSGAVRPNRCICSWVGFTVGMAKIERMRMWPSKTSVISIRRDGERSSIPRAAYSDSGLTRSGNGFIAE